MYSTACLEGCHSSVVLLSTGGRAEDADGSCEIFSGFFKTFLKMCQSYNAGLSSSYISIIADSHTQTCLENVKVAVGKWHRLATPLFRTPLHRNSKDRKAAARTGADSLQIYYDFTALEDLITELASPRVPAGAVCGSERHSVSICQRGSEMATQLHSLWDAVPWNPTDYVVVDVYWLVSGSVGYSPSSAVQLYGSLLRLKKWNDAHIQIVSSDNKLTGQLLEWKEMLGTPPISAPTDWCVNLCVVWRGALRFTEHKVPRQVQPQVVAFPGFALTLLPTPRVSCWAGADLLAGVGLKGGCPSHLEVVQVVDVPTVPLFWLSPLHCVLSLENTSFPDSVALFRDLLTAKAKAKQPIGLIMRLCLSEKDGQQGQHRTTADWMSYIQDSESEDVSTPSPLDSFLPGPLLLVCPCDQSDYRCDAWFLWKPESIRTGVFQQEGRGLQIAEDAMDTDLCRELPLIELTSEHNHTTTDRESDATHVCPQQSFHHRLSLFSNKLDHPPCECPEMMALQMHEWIQRKMIRRLATPDLMFGQVLAPPPSTKETMDAGDLLSCFTETGSPAVCELSPIAMNDPSRMMKIHNPSTGDVSYHSIMASTPSSKKHYHGVNYCLTDGNTLDARLTRIQQCYLVSERASNCSTSNTPRSNRLRRRKASQGPQNTSEGSKKLQSESSPSKATSSTSDSLAAKSRKAPPRTIKRMSPVVKVTKVSTLKRLGKKIKPVKVNEKGALCLPQSGSTTPSTQIPYQPPTNLHPSKSQQKLPTTIKAVSENSSSKLQDMATVKLDTLDPTLLDGATETYTQVQGLRRSPRKNKWQLECSSKSQEKLSQGKKSEQRKRQLEEVIVATLKANNLRRSHPCFRKCYTRLFTLSKSFLKDMKTTKGLAEEMKKVAEFNVSQVIDFELRQAGLRDGSSTDP